MLPLPDLDDRTFEQIVREARSQIPQLFPPWTDENVHDPGITFIELFAWLTEMQQYYLNRVTDKNELKFLKLLGLAPAPATAARTDVTFSGGDRPAVIPRGTKLLAADVPFETEERLYYVPARIDKLLVRTEEEAIDVTATNRHDGVSFFAFGPEAASGSRLYIGLDRELPVGETISLSVRLDERYPVPLPEGREPGDFFEPSAALSWLCYGVETARGTTAEAFVPLEIVRDETAGLSFSGKLLFRLPAPMRPIAIHPANDKGRYWLCCAVASAGYELAPKIEELALNTVSAMQLETFSEAFDFAGSGEPGLRVTAAGRLPYRGRITVQVREGEEGWADWRECANLANFGADDAVYTLARDPQAKAVAVKFGDGVHGRIPPAGPDSVRLIAYAPEFEAERYIGGSSGLPNQRFTLRRTPIAGSGFRLQTARRGNAAGEYVWQDWQLVGDFDRSTPDDRHFTLDAESGEIRFGNNEQGRVPERSDGFANIRVVALRTGGGERGNVKNRLINRLAEHEEDLAGIAPSNAAFASGGKQPETLEQLKRRAPRMFRLPGRAVTCEDYEEIVRTTPGLRVARVKAIPLYKPGLADYPANRAPAHTTVVVVPYGESRKPRPSRGFLANVRRHLDKHRLITTEIHVISPEYVKITVHAVVAVDSRLHEGAEYIVRALNDFLQPFDPAGPGGRSRGWDFGRAVYKGDIYGVINPLPGVLYVRDLWIFAEGKGVTKEADGDIRLPPHGLVYSGAHEIELIGH